MTLLVVRLLKLFQYISAYSAVMLTLIHLLVLKKFL